MSIGFIRVSELEPEPAGSRLLFFVEVRAGAWARISVRLEPEPESISPSFGWRKPKCHLIQPRYVKFNQKARLELDSQAFFSISLKSLGPDPFFLLSGANLSWNFWSRSCFKTVFGPGAEAVPNLASPDKVKGPSPDKVKGPYWFIICIID